MRKNRNVLYKKHPHYRAAKADYTQLLARLLAQLLEKERF